MQRRNFLKLIGAVVLAPSLPISVVKSEWGWFKYKGYRFRKDLLLKYGGVIQLYTTIEINGKWYHNAVWMDKDDWKHTATKNMYLDSMVQGIEKMKRRLAG